MKGGYFQSILPEKYIAYPFAPPPLRVPVVDLERHKPYRQKPENRFTRNHIATILYSKND